MAHQYTPVDSQGIDEDEYDGLDCPKTFAIVMVGWLTCAIFGGVLNSHCIGDWSDGCGNGWSIVDRILFYGSNIFAFLLFFGMSFGFPGWAVFIYTMGWGNNGPGSRFESFNINTTMGPCYRLSNMSHLDHWMIPIATATAYLLWIPHPKAQAIAIGFCVLCGSYMFLWWPVNLLVGTLKFPGALCDVTMLLFIFWCGVGSSRFFGSLMLPTRLLSYPIYFAVTILGILLLLVLVGIIGRGKVRNVWALTVECLNEHLQIPPAGVPWPKGKKFPSGWSWEPPPFGDKKGWPAGPWPEAANDCKVTQSRIDAAQNELNSIFMLPIQLSLGVLVILIGTFVLLVCLA